MFRLLYGPCGSGVGSGVSSGVGVGSGVSVGAGVFSGVGVTSGVGVASGVGVTFGVFRWNWCRSYFLRSFLAAVSGYLFIAFKIPLDE